MKLAFAMAISSRLKDGKAYDGKPISLKVREAAAEAYRLMTTPRNGSKLPNDDPSLVKAVMILKVGCSKPSYIYYYIQLIELASTNCLL